MRIESANPTDVNERKCKKAFLLCAMTAATVRTDSLFVVAVVVVVSSVTISGDLLDFGQLLKAFGNN